MMPWKQVEALFGAAVDLPPERRHALLDVSCEDESVREAVVRLLTAHEKAGDFLERLNPDWTAALLESVDAPIEEGLQFGPYRVIRELGRGGMGVVYLAGDTRLDRLVALKFLSPRLSADERAKQRLVSEAKAASALDHPNIAIVHDISETEAGQLFIAMAYYDGPTLDDELEHGPMSIERALSLARQLAEGLQAAHENGVVHRDVKPGNVIVTSHDVPKLVDFGIAKARMVGLTDEGTRLGTVAYMSPEQTRGEAVDGRSDLWSLGVMLYEMLTGARPFMGDHDQATIYAIRHDAPERVERLRPEVPSDVVRIVEKLLTKEAAARYPYASALAADLRALNGKLPSPGSSESMKKSGGVRNVRLHIALILLIVFLVAGGGLFAWRARHAADAAAPTSTVKGLPPASLAVLPLASLSRDPDDEYIAEGLTDELISRLSRLDGLQVIARTSSMTYKGSDKSIAEIGAELGVRTVLEGSVRTTTDSVRLIVQLVDTESQRHLWSDDFDTEMGDVLAVQSEIARRIAEALHVQMRERDRLQLAKRGTDVPEAHLMYLKGRYFWNKRTAAWFKQSRTYFQQALDLDPTYAEAWAGLADCYAMLSSIDELPPSESYAMARSAAERALALDPELAEAHTTLATIYLDQYEWEDAERHFDRALAANPSYALAHQRYSLHLSVMGEHTKAVQMAERARALDPLSAYAGAAAGYALYLARRYDEAAAHLLKVREMDPTFFLTYLDLGLVYIQQGKYDDAIDEFERGIALSEGEPNVKGLLGYAYGVSGRRDDARRTLAELDRLSSERYISPVHKALIHLTLDEKAESVALLEKAHSERAWLVSLLNVEPLFDPLRSEPGFHALIEKMGFSGPD